MFPSSMRIEETETSVLVVLGYGYDQAKVGRDHPVLDRDELALLGFAFALARPELADMRAKGLDILAYLHLVFGGQQGIARYLLEVEGEWVGFLGMLGFLFFRQW